MFSLGKITLLLLSTIGGIIFSYMLQFPLFIGFLPGFWGLVYFSLKSGIKGSVLLVAIRRGILRTGNVLWILVFVGLLIPAWMASGTIPAMIKLGLTLLNPQYFLVSSFLIAAAISLLLGSSTAALSTIGVALIGVGAVLNVPLPLVAGALVSGAFVGDRTSPLSSAHQLVASCTRVSLADHLKNLLPTTYGALVICHGLFLTLV